MNAVHVLEEYGVKEIYAACTHGVLSGNAIEKINNCALKELIITNTIKQPAEKHSDKIKVLSVGNLLGQGIIRILEDEPLSDLFTYQDDSIRK